MAEIPFSTTGISPFDVAVKAARCAGDLLLNYFGNIKQVKSKGYRNLVSEADLGAEKLIIEILRKAYPDIPVISEESNSDKKVEVGLAWVVDPLDGTNNFISGIPHFAVNIALIKDNRVIVAITFDPNRDELFHSVYNGGAFLNGANLFVSTQKDIKSSLIGLDMGYDAEKGKHNLRMLNDLWPGIHGFRLMGSAALGLAYVAAGRLNLYLHRSVYPWDICCGLLLVSEAGGIMTDWHGYPAMLGSDMIVAGNSTLCRDFLAWNNDLPRLT